MKSLAEIANHRKNAVEFIEENSHGLREFQIAGPKKGEKITFQIRSGKNGNLIIIQIFANNGGFEVYFQAIGNNVDSTVEQFAKHTGIELPDEFKRSAGS